MARGTSSNAGFQVIKKAPLIERVHFAPDFALPYPLRNLESGAFCQTFGGKSLPAEPNKYLV